MAAEKGNNYAEKWTVEEARKLASQAFKAVDKDCFFISSIAEKCETYRDLFQYLLKKFNDDKEVFRTLKRMYNKCESIIWEKASNCKMDKTIAIFALKSLHGLMETSKLETESNVNLNIEQATDKELDAKIKALKS